MKKIILFVLLISLGALFAELQVDIPFDLNIVGDDFSVVGAYTYESDWITITNIGSTSEEYNLTWSFSNLPAGWTCSVCNATGLCYIPNMPATIPLDAGASLGVHFIIGVNSTGGCDLNITLDGGDLTSPMSYDFTFNTEDNVSNDEELISVPRLSQNYPNPFNPTTTIALNLSSSELAEAELIIFNSKGQIVKTFNELNSQVIWNGTNDSGKPVNSGIYFYQLKTGDYSITKKMVLMK
ncbi:MAG: T9SS type A sorting domain-containing protein [Candidatus Cloacimonetes bacterium]|nr:T9SS type A sorting domain-containing protein [Candidatus Cloacimonadota bacterium]MCF7814585.1 T9SS type A sorting domain-containing protein [Candidatus Cloacimonadota bacterium]MCF7869098.1 T9SS type A sorting domain-containing protein [Candidatus Cloacimonadota bacterium]MCF7884515.1 T9SS type A sorting domain-containing protein [Candidatus Cloacimonadota bacterium]